MTPKIRELLRHLSKGFNIQNEDELELSLEGLVLFSRLDNASDTYSFGELEDFEIYVDPRDTTIEDLKEIIKQQQDVIQNMSKKQQEKPTRKAYVSLNAKEELQLCQRVKDNPKIKNARLAEEFDISNSYVGRILQAHKVRMPRTYQKATNENAN